MARRGGSHLVVAAIDFGTTYSGYAYSFRDEFNKDPLTIHTNQQWTDKESQFVSYKAPTSILFDTTGEFKSFGFAAEATYNDLMDDEEEDGWRFFRRFKMSLYREMKSECARPVKKIGRELKLRDAQGQPMPAMDIFSAAICYLKQHFLSVLMDAVMNMTPDDVHWVLTVPAIWSDAAKQFMREAAKQAGIKDEQLTLALEPEAAALYCKEIAVKTEKEGGGSKDLSAFTPSEQFLILDIGGGTVDITCHEVTFNGTLKEIESPSGGPWGGTVVDEAYFSFLKDLVGREAWTDFETNHQSDLLELERTFEMKKRIANDEEHAMIRVGVNFLQSYKTVHKSTLAKTLSESGSVYSPLVEVKKEKLKIRSDQMIEFFHGPMNNIVQHLECMFKKTSMRRVSTILMVGGFSESALMKRKIKTSFPEKTVIRPLEASMAVLKGAVIFGHAPHAICERTSPRTYGISVSVPYNDRIHPRKSWYVCDGKEMSTDVFKVMVKIGQQVIMGKTKADHVCRPARARDTESVVEVYESTEENPEYTFSPSCRKLGELRMSMPDTTKGKERTIVVTLHFGFTELKVTAIEEGTKTTAEAKFDCLN